MNELQFMINHPRVLCLTCVVAMWLMALVGVHLRSRLKPDSDKESLALVVSATLTLLGLIVGFSFSMATSRYDQRRLYEENEANAIGTEYVRADLLPAVEAASVRDLLRQYTTERLAFYRSDYGTQLRQVDGRVNELQAALWASVQHQALTNPTPVTALVVSGMNDVLNTQGYTQFSWWNRIPTAAWALMIFIALLANLLVGFATNKTGTGRLLLVVLPIIIGISIFLVSDIDSPRGGVIRIEPRDLMTLMDSMRGN